MLNQSRLDCAAGTTSCTLLNCDTLCCRLSLVTDIYYQLLWYLLGTVGCVNDILNDLIKSPSIKPYFTRLRLLSRSLPR